MNLKRRSDLAAILSRALTRRRVKAGQTATGCAIYNRQSNQVDVKRASASSGKNEVSSVAEKEQVNTEVSQ
ncbi:hypothetical protein [Novipirellula rosea]|uniref:Uncharacterized protein n=1 Tax=Novipirellula rosea TaxID=1031540 RepID=A0ABP8MLP7_9BACT